MTVIFAVSVLTQGGVYFPIRFYSNLAAAEADAKDLGQNEERTPKARVNAYEVLDSYDKRSTP